MSKKHKALTPLQMQRKLNQIIMHMSGVGDLADKSFKAIIRMPRGNPEETLPRRKAEIEAIIADMDKFGVSKVNPNELSVLIDLYDAVLYQETDVLSQFIAIADKIKEVAPELTEVIDQNIEAATERIKRRR